MISLTCPRPPFVADIHPALTKEMIRALEDRLAARERGDWIDVRACDMVITVLRRIQTGKSFLQEASR